MHDMGEGVVLFFRGFCKKVLFADLLARAIDPVFADPAAFSALHCLFAVYGFAFQIFYDFSGYTDMARGAARMLGYDLPINFNHPYLSTSFRDFWKRWHISLSTWIRDYLYISLGGSRKGRVRTYVNLLLTMTLAGLWHGANATFILWGLFHGAMLSIERAVVPFVKGNDFFSAPAVMIARRLVVFHLVCAGWILFRCDSVAGAVRMVLCLFSGSWLPSAGPVAALGSAIGVFALWNIVSGAAEKYNLAGVWFGRIRVVMYGAAAAAAFIYSTTSQPFIYFQF
jgi:D-alanyl-lipoteichoic acid acyltransferase DltB (MBOAT superfamily)